MSPTGAPRLSVVRRPKAPETLSSAEARRILVESLIDQWGEESFPASDPPGRLPPSFAQPTKRRRQQG